MLLMTIVAAAWAMRRLLARGAGNSLTRVVAPRRGQPRGTARIALATPAGLRDDRRMLTLQLLVFRLACSALLPLAATACAAPGTPPRVPAASVPAASVPASASAAAAAWRQLQAEVGTAACDNARQCQTLALGNKACGGPERFVAWSSAASNATRVGALAAQYAEASRRENEREGLSSTCNVVADPGATCQGGRCALLPPSAGLQLQK